MKPIIGIVGRTNKVQYNKYKIIVNDNHRRAVIAVGGIPISILPTQNIKYEKENNEKTNFPLSIDEKNDINRVINLCDGIILQGGYYSFYYDEYVARYCLENDIPILGTCLGAQVLAAVDCNTSRKQNVEPIESEVDHNQYENDNAHYVNIISGTNLHNILQVDKTSVNSRHKNKIKNLKTAKMVATSEDGVIEAIEFPGKKFAIGLQWHPEDLFETDSNMYKIFKAFIDASTKL